MSVTVSSVKNLRTGRAQAGRAGERRALQGAILLAGCVPVFGGGAGAILGGRAFGALQGPGADSHVRYLSGLLLAIGLTYWGCVPTIERRGAIIRTLTQIVFLGGLARLAGVLALGDPGPMRWALVMELGVVPVIALWQARVSSAWESPPPRPDGTPAGGLDALSRPR